MAGSERDFVGYGGRPPRAEWPGGARIALVVVLNMEEGAEPSIGDGDPATETALTDAVPGEVPAGTRDYVAESLFEYGSRAGFWRLANLFGERGTPLTLNLCARAIARNPPIADAVRASDHDICCHGDRFVRHFAMDRDEERQAIARAVAGLEASLGRRPSGWQSRYSPSRHTRELLVEQGGFLYDADSYADDLPFWTKVGGQNHLVVPHSFTNNDNRLATAKLSTANDFYDHLASAFRVLYAEGASRPKLMTVSLHCRVTGQPARFEALPRFLDFVAAHDRVWMARRSDVARHWMTHHPAGDAA